MSIRTEKKELVAIQRKMIQVANDLSKEGGAVVRGVAKSTLIVVRGAKKGVPVDRGLLRSSITPEVIVRDNLVRGVVGSNRKYAAAQETGTKPYWPPFKPLLRWAMRKLKTRKKSQAWGLAVYVQERISKHGIKAKKYLVTAFEDNRDKITRILERAVNKSVEK